MQLKQFRQQGIALFSSLIFMVIAAGVLLLIFGSTLREMSHSNESGQVTSTLLLARSTAALSEEVFNSHIVAELETIITTRASATNPKPFGSGANPDPDSVASDLQGVATDLQSKIDDLVCSVNLNPIGGTGSASLKIYVSAQACGDALPSSIKLPAGSYVTGSGAGAGDTYAIPYVAVAEASIGDFKRNVVIQGAYHFVLTTDTFAKYASFTNSFKDSTGKELWFGSNTLLDGPVHTNQSFRFAGQPWLGGKVTSSGFSDSALSGASEGDTGDATGATYWMDGNNFEFKDATTLNSDTSHGNTTPQFAGGVDWEVPFIQLPSNALDQKTQAANSGLSLTGPLYSLKMWAANSSGVEQSSNASHQFIEVCVTVGDCTEYRFSDNQKLESNESGTWTQVQANFNGLVYVEGGGVERMLGPQRIGSNIDSAKPAFASFAQLTVVAEGSVRITGDLKYEDPPCTGSPKRNTNGSITAPSCNNLTAKNVFGVFTPNDDVLIGNGNADASLNAPDDIAVHGSFMASTGSIKVENHDMGFPRGNVRLLGGMIQDAYGAFGKGAPDSMNSGYGRQITYDPRFTQGLTPPSFPGRGKTLIRETNGVFLFKYGQREQVKL